MVLSINSHPHISYAPHHSTNTFFWREQYISSFSYQPAFTSLMYHGITQPCTYVLLDWLPRNCREDTKNCLLMLSSSHPSYLYPHNCIHVVPLENYSSSSFAGNSLYSSRLCLPQPTRDLSLPGSLALTSPRKCFLPGEGRSHLSCWNSPPFNHLSALKFRRN